MNISKEYIELCKNEKVQGLRPELRTYDYYYFYYPCINKEAPPATGVSIVIEEYPGQSYEFNKQRNNNYWLPTGDQLDEEIVKIIDSISDEGNRHFEFNYLPLNKTFYCAFHYDICCENNEDYKGNPIIELWDTNPLIAKIKLLISLLDKE